MWGRRNAIGGWQCRSGSCRGYQVAHEQPVNDEKDDPDDSSDRVGDFVIHQTMGWPLAFRSRICANVSPRGLYSKCGLSWKLVQSPPHIRPSFLPMAPMRS